MEMTCHPRLGGARPKGERGSSESSAYLAILLYLFIFWNLRYKKMRTVPPAARKRGDHKRSAVVG